MDNTIDRIVLPPALSDNHCHLSLLSNEERLANLSAFARCERAFLLDVAIRPFVPAYIQPLRKKYPFLHYSLGIHPGEAGHADVDKWLELVEKVPSDVIAIGETGLDRYKYAETYPKQCELFEFHLELAEKSDLPIIIHNRNADDAILEMHRGRCRGLIHCFCSDKKTAFRALDAGLYLSFGGIISYKKSNELRSLLPSLPQHRILAETDAPFLAPQTYRGKKNHPVYVSEVIAVIADCLGRSVIDTAELVYENCCRLYGIGHA